MGRKRNVERRIRRKRQGVRSGFVAEVGKREHQRIEPDRQAVETVLVGDRANTQFRNAHRGARKPLPARSVLYVPIDGAGHGLRLSGILRMRRRSNEPPCPQRHTARRKPMPDLMCRPAQLEYNYYICLLFFHKERSNTYPSCAKKAISQSGSTKTVAISMPSERGPWDAHSNKTSGLGYPANSRSTARLCFERRRVPRSSPMRI